MPAIYLKTDDRYTKYRKWKIEKKKKERKKKSKSGALVLFEVQPVSLSEYIYTLTYENNTVVKLYKVFIF